MQDTTPDTMMRRWSSLPDRSKLAVARQLGPDLDVALAIFFAKVGDLCYGDREGRRHHLLLIERHVRRLAPFQPGTEHHRQHPGAKFLLALVRRMAGVFCRSERSGGRQFRQIHMVLGDGCDGMKDRRRLRRRKGRRCRKRRVDCLLSTHTYAHTHNTSCSGLTGVSHPGHSSMTVSRASQPKSSV